jgi:putative sterol carrier protein
MTNATTDFFEGLAQRGHEPLLEKTSGTLRFELTNGSRQERWLVSVEKGDIAISHRNEKADCTLRAPKDLFESVAAGEANAMAAVLRGAMAIEGNWELLVLFQRLFPSAPQAASDSRREVVATGVSGQ